MRHHRAPPSSSGTRAARAPESEARLKQVRPNVRIASHDLERASKVRRIQARRHRRLLRWRSMHCPVRRAIARSSNPNPCRSERARVMLPRAHARGGVGGAYAFMGSARCSRRAFRLRIVQSSSAPTSEGNGRGRPPLALVDGGRARPSRPPRRPCADGGSGRSAACASADETQSRRAREHPRGDPCPPGVVRDQRRLV